ncbi:MAG: GNAT family N-acetyltransferase [Chloroflexota bacterium]
MQPELVTVPEYLQGARIFLRPYTLADAAAQWAAIEESRSHLQRWIRHAPSLKSVDDVGVALAHDRAQWVLRKRLIFGVFEHANGGYLGQSAFHHIDWKVPTFELGYWLRRSAEGHGYMREAVGLMSRLAFDQLGARRIEARVNPRNLRSRRVLEALGWECEGRLRQCARDAEGVLIDVDVFALVSAPSGHSCQ